MLRKLVLLIALGLTPLEATVDANLVGYYPFESDYANASGSLPDGTAVNSPTAATSGGRVGKAMSLQGADNDHMNLVASFGTGTTLGENFTISAWYRLNDPITSPSAVSYTHLTLPTNREV